MAYLLFSQVYAQTILTISLTSSATDLAVKYTTASLGLLLILSLPIILTLIFSKFNPDTQVVSPLNMQIITFSALLVILYIQNNLQVNSLLISGFGTIVFGIVQDITVTSLVGQKADQNDIFTASFIADKELSELKSLLLSTTFRGNLGLDEKVEEIEQGFILRSPSGSQYQTVVMLKKGKEESKTYVDLAVFEKGKYTLKSSDELKEFAKEHRAKYLKSILRRSSITCEKIEDRQLAKSHTDDLCNLVKELVKGKAMRVHVPAVSAIKAIGVFASMAICILGYSQNWLHPDTVLSILVPTIVYALFESLPRIRGKGKNTA